MSTADVDALIKRLGEIMEGQAALTCRLTEAMERMSDVVAKHETQLRRCRCHTCKSYEPTALTPMDAPEDQGPAVSR